MKTPVQKKDESTDKENYTPVSVLPLLPKIFERLIYGQFNKYLYQYLNSLLCGFRKAHSKQHALFRLLQEWQNDLDKSGFVGTILMDLTMDIQMRRTDNFALNISFSNISIYSP